MNLVITVTIRKGDGATATREELELNAMGPERAMSLAETLVRVAGREVADTLTVIEQAFAGRTGGLEVELGLVRVAVEDDPATNVVAGVQTQPWAWKNV